MASMGALTRRLAPPRVRIAQQLAQRGAAIRSSPRQSLSTSIPAAARRPALGKRQLQQPQQQLQVLRRRYATETASEAGDAPPLPPPPKPKPRRFRKLLFTWRLTYLSFLGGMVYIGYSIYKDRHPADQIDADPAQKTLVILGTGWGSVSLLKNLDTENYNVIVISPRNYFLFTPLLPSCTTGLIEHRSIMEPVRSILRSKRAKVKYYEAEATSIDPDRKVVKISDNSDIKGAKSQTEVPYDMLVVGVGAENATFGISGVREHSCFLKEIDDAQSIRKKIMDCVETAAFKDQTPEEIDRLLSVVVVGGGPTGVEFAGELQDFFEQDIKKLIPEISDRFKVTLVEALPNVLPSFSKQLIDYTERSLKEDRIAIETKTVVKRVTDKAVEAVTTRPDGTKEDRVLPYGLLVWATGNAVRPLVRDLMGRIPAQKESRRGLATNEYLVVQGSRDIWAIGDCAVAGYVATAQVASQEGAFLARLFNNMARTGAIESKIQELSSSMNLKPGNAAEITKEIEEHERQLRRIKDIKPFRYSHQGSLAYIGSDKAVADISWLDGNFATGGRLTFLFWRSAYLSMCFSARNRILVVNDWIKSKIFGRDISRE